MTHTALPLDGRQGQARGEGDQCVHKYIYTLLIHTVFNRPTRTPVSSPFPPFHPVFYRQEGPPIVDPSINPFPVYSTAWKCV